MTQNNVANQLSALGEDGYVSAEDVTFLRRNVFQDGIVSVQELNSLIALGEKAPNGDPEWPQYFSEAAADHYLRQEEPPGYLTSAEFQRLKAQVLQDGPKVSNLEMTLLVHLLKNAGGLAAVRDAYGSKSIRTRRKDDDEIASAIAEQVTAREADWLADRINNDGAVHDVEQALLAYMRDLEADLPPKLRALVKHAA